MIEIYLDTHKTIPEVVCKNIYIYNHQAILFLPNLEKVIWPAPGGLFYTQLHPQDPAALKPVLTSQ